MGTSSASHICGLITFSISLPVPVIFNRFSLSPSNSVQGSFSWVHRARRYGPINGTYFVLFSGGIPCI